MAVDHASGISASKPDPVFLHVKSGMTVIVTDTDGAVSYTHLTLPTILLV